MRFNFHATRNYMRPSFALVVLSLFGIAPHLGATTLCLNFPQSGCVVLDSEPTFLAYADTQNGSVNLAYTPAFWGVGVQSFFMFAPSGSVHVTAQHLTHGGGPNLGVNTFGAVVIGDPQTTGPFGDSQIHGSFARDFLQWLWVGTGEFSSRLYIRADEVAVGMAPPRIDPQQFLAAPGVAPEPGSAILIAAGIVAILVSRIGRRARTSAVLGR
jgi:hypothetical protein